MHDNQTLKQLEDLAERLGITIRYEPLHIDGSVHLGGFCHFNNQDYLIINKKTTSKEKIHIIIDSVKRRNLTDVFIVPSLRALLEK